MPTISKCFVWNVERAKKLREYLPPTSTPPTKATSTATPTTPANPLLYNPKLQQAIKNAQKEGFVRIENGHYIWCNKDKNGKKLYPYQYACFFADEAEKKGVATISIVSDLFKIPDLGAYRNRLKADVKATNIKNQIKRFFD